MYMIVKRNKLYIFPAHYVVKSLEFIHVEFSYILNRLWGNNYATKTILITEQSILRRFNIMQPGINTLSRK